MGSLIHIHHTATTIIINSKHRITTNQIRYLGANIMLAIVLSKQNVAAHGTFVDYATTKLLKKMNTNRIESIVIRPNGSNACDAARNNMRENIVSILNVNWNKMSIR